MRIRPRRSFYSSVRAYAVLSVVILLIAAIDFFIPGTGRFAIASLPILVAAAVVGVIIITLIGWYLSDRRWRLMLDRERRGLCVGCGYDVRACTDRCPECGEKIWPRTNPLARPAPAENPAPK